MLNEEKQLRQIIRSIIREAMDGMLVTEGKGKKGSKNKQGKKVVGKGKDTKTIKNSKVKVKRQRVTEKLKSSTTNCAPYAYALWPNKDKDNARSQFYKCRDEKPNDNGEAYSFTDAEITKLYSMLSDEDIN